MCFSRKANEIIATFSLYSLHSPSYGALYARKDVKSKNGVQRDDKKYREEQNTKRK